MCSRLTIKTSDDVFIANFEHVSHLVLVFLHVIVGWVYDNFPRGIF